MVASVPNSAGLSTPAEYTFNTTAIRVVELDGSPWFVAADVCQAIGFYVRADGFANASGACSKLDEDEKQRVMRSTVNPIVSSFPNTGLVCVSESGLYKLIMRSDKPEAKAFQDWVTREVLPAIRKDGGYIQGEETRLSRADRGREDAEPKSGCGWERGLSPRKPPRSVASMPPIP